jgi:hypothetical protein
MQQDPREDVRGGGGDDRVGHAGVDKGKKRRHGIGGRRGSAPDGVVSDQDAEHGQRFAVDLWIRGKRGLGVEEGDEGAVTAGT